jgi:holo-[acyl-carrier protein] synthase
VTVLGLGIDLVNIDGFSAQLGDGASLFADATFTRAELNDARRKPGGAALHLAARFAAKEAFLKAWGAQRVGKAPAVAKVDLRSIEVRSDSYGRPHIYLHEPVRSQFNAKPTVRIHCSLTHEHPVAAAVVMIEDHT